MSVNKLRGKLVEKGISVAVLADRMGISKSGMYRKIHSPGKMTIGDAVKLKKILALTDEDAVDIFLS